MFNQRRLFDIIDGRDVMQRRVGISHWRWALAVVQHSCFVNILIIGTGRFQTWEKNPIYVQCLGIARLSFFVPFAADFPENPEQEREEEKERKKGEKERISFLLFPLVAPLFFHSRIDVRYPCSTPCWIVIITVGEEKKNVFLLRSSSRRKSREMERESKTGMEENCSANEIEEEEEKEQR